MLLVRSLLLLGLVVALVHPVWLGAGEDPVAALALIRSDPPVAAEGFTIPTPTGGSIGLAQYRGKVVFLNFWATWCPPCREEMPGMQRLYERFRDQGFAVLAVSIDADEALVPPFLTEHRLTFPVGLDLTMEVADQYRVTALPSTFLLDRKGRIVARALGPRQWDGPDGFAVIEQLLKQP